MLAERKSIERISALLAKAERTDNAAEAEAYLMKAQSLATAASVDLAFARAQTRRAESRQNPEMRTVTIGEKGKRANRHLVSLFIAIAYANDAKVDVATNSTYVMAFGMPGDLDAIEALFTSLAVQMIISAQEWLSLGSWQGETYLSQAKVSGRIVQLPKAHTAQTAKVSFFRAFIARIAERLTLAHDQAVADALARRGPGRVTKREGTIVLKQKSDEIREFHRANSTARGAWGGYSGGVGADLGTAGKAGRRAGSRARLAAQRSLPGKTSVEGAGDGR